MKDATSEQEALLEALLAELDPLAEEMVARTREAIPSFERVPRDEQLADTRRSLERLLRGSITGSPALERELEELGRRRAAQGVAVEELLQSWRMSVRIGTDRARSVGAELGIPPELVIEVFQDALGAADDAMVPLAAGYRRDSSGMETEDFVYAALVGSLRPEQLRAEANALGLDLTRRYRAIRARGPAATELVGPGSELLAEAGGRVGLFVGGDGELAGFSALAPTRREDVLVAVGPEVALESLPASDRVAGRVLAAAHRFGLIGVQDLRSAGLHVAVLESGDVGEALVERFVGPLREAANPEELLASLRAWLEAGMRVDPAAGRLHVHPNTLRYRLGRYSELTGVDLGVSEEIVGLWWALQRQLAADGEVAAADR